MASTNFQSGVFSVTLLVHGIFFLHENVWQLLYGNMIQYTLNRTPDPDFLTTPLPRPWQRTPGGGGRWSKPRKNREKPRFFLKIDCDRDRDYTVCCPGTIIVVSWNENLESNKWDGAGGFPCFTYCIATWCGYLFWLVPQDKTMLPLLLWKWREDKSCRCWFCDKLVEIEIADFFIISRVMFSDKMKGSHPRIPTAAAKPRNREWKTDKTNKIS